MEEANLKLIPSTLKKKSKYFKPSKSQLNTRFGGEFADQSGGRRSHIKTAVASDKSTLILQTIEGDFVQVSVVPVSVPHENKRKVFKRNKSKGAFEKFKQSPVMNGLLVSLGSGVAAASVLPTASLALLGVAAFGGAIGYALSDEIPSEE